MKVVVAPDKFKGSLSAPEAAEAIGRGWARGWPECEVVLAPIADGGEGFAEIFARGHGGKWVELEVQDPLGRPISGKYVWLEEEKTAVLEMSEASGLWRLGREELAPLEANTFGTGQLMRHAAERGARQIIVGLGGSATTDGGAGMAAALGFRFLAQKSGREEEIVPFPRDLGLVSRIDRSAAIPLPVVLGACDVTNPLLGPAGTARVFAPQKGANAAVVELLERNLTVLADVVARDLDRDARTIPGAGAAGGFGFGLLSFCGGKLEPGFEAVSKLLGLETLIEDCDLVVTGEGRLDEQTLGGKGPSGVVGLARRAGKPVLGLAGAVSAEAEEIFDAALPIVDEPVPLDHAMKYGAIYLERAAARAARLLRLGAKCPGSTGLELSEPTLV